MNTATKPIFVLLASFNLLCDCDAATFAGSSTWRGLFYTDGTLGSSRSQGASASIQHGTVDFDATLEAGMLGFDSIRMAQGVPSSVARSSADIISPITFQTTTITSEVSVDPFSLSFSAPPTSVFNSGGSLVFREPSFPVMNITGTYSISGPSETVQGTFSASLPGTRRATNITLDVSTFFNTISFGFMGGNFSNGDSFVPIASHVVDGVAVDLDLGTLFFSQVTTAAATLNATVPEPSAAILFLSGLLLLFRRRGR